MARFHTKCLRAFWRPACLFMALCLCVGGMVFYRAAPPAPDSQVMFILFHDQNGSGRQEAGEGIPQASAVLGFSGAGFYYSGEVTTAWHDFGTYQANYGGAALPAGSYQIKPQSIPAGYRLGGTYLTLYRDSGAERSSASGFAAVKGDLAYVYVPLRKVERASATGKVSFADAPGSGVTDCRVDLLNDSATQLLGTVRTASDGSYRFENLEPGYYRVQVTPPTPAGNSIHYQLDEPRSAPFLVLDGQANTGPDFAVSRVAPVQLWMNGILVGELPGIPFGQTVPTPDISSSFLNFSGGYYTITGWYRDAALTQPWNFDRDTISGPVSLHAAYTTTYHSTGSGSGSSSGGSSRQDTYALPVIKNASAVINGDQVTLSVEMDSIFDVFDYLWQMKGSDGSWIDLHEARSAVSTLGGIQPGATYTFRVVVWGSTDSRQVESGEITVRAPGGIAEELPADTGGGDAPEYIPPSGGWDGSTSAFTVSSDVLFVNGRMEATATTPGGKWSWDKNYFDAEGGNTPTPLFTSLQSGTTTISYTQNGQTTTVTVLIHPASLPATGQSMTPVLLLGGAGTLVLLAAALLYLREKNKRRRRHAC